MRKLGPGLVTGAADDDPSGIATYSQAGAKFGYELGWTVVLTYPLMVAVQMISARLGRVTGRGLADNIRENFPAPVLYALVIMLLVANTINVAADVAAMGQSLQLVVGGPAATLCRCLRRRVPRAGDLPFLPPLCDVTSSG